MVSKRSALLSVVLGRASARTVQASTQPRCYFPDGSIDTAGYICNTTSADSGGVSACCLSNDACYESGTCFQDWSGVMYRQSCTDPSWRDANCPQMCLGKGQLNLGVWVQTCDMANGKACCVEDDLCCNDTSNWFDYKPGYLVAAISGDGSNRLGPYVSAGSSPSSSSAAASSSSSSSTTSLSSSNPSTLASSSSSSQTTASTNSNGDERRSSTNTVAIAVGVVFGTGFALACAGLLLSLKRFRQEKKQRLVAAEQLAQLQSQPQQQAAMQEPKTLDVYGFGRGHGQSMYSSSISQNQSQSQPYGQSGAWNEMPDGMMRGGELSATETAVSELPSAIEPQ